MKADKHRRVVLRTVLLVGEGYAEAAFLQHLKALFVERQSGLSVSVKNARGKGALGVVNFAVRQSQNAAYDVKAALLDTDTGWDAKTQAIARREKISVVPCQPCLEAMLLALHGDATQGKSTQQLKQAFTVRFGTQAHDAALYAKHFPKARLDKSRGQSPELEQLLALISAA